MTSGTIRNLLPSRLNNRGIEQNVVRVQWDSAWHEVPPGKARRFPVEIADHFVKNWPAIEDADGNVVERIELIPHEDATLLVGEGEAQPQSDFVFEGVAYESAAAMIAAIQARAAETPDDKPERKRQAFRGEREPALA